MLTCSERALAFDCNGEQLLGVLAVPPVSIGTASTAVIVVVGGPQYRAGSHRHFVRVARQLAGAGFAVLRFDVRGMGDSSGEQRSFEDLSPDIGAAIEATFKELSSLRHVVLWGLCDGASAALLYLHDHSDPRVQGLCLLNPWVRSEETLAQTHVKHYYLQRALQPEAWRKLLRGGMGWSAFAGFWSALHRAVRHSSSASPDATTTGARPALYQQAMAAAWQRFKGNILLVLSGNDYTAKEFVQYTQLNPALRAAVRQAGVTRVDLQDADHTLSDAVSQAQLGQALLNWLRQAPALRPV